MITFHILEVEGAFVAACAMNSDKGIGKMRATYEADGEFTSGSATGKTNCGTTSPGSRR
jgi:hypothetical protein